MKRRLEKYVPNVSFPALNLPGLQVSPVPAHFSQTATDVTQGKAGKGSIRVEGDNNGWVDMWVAVPAWAQGTGQIGKNYFSGTAPIRTNLILYSRLYGLLFSVSLMRVIHSLYVWWYPPISIFGACHLRDLSNLLREKI